MGDNKSIHDGHRDRVRDRFLRDGLDSFEEHQIIELLLFYGIPRKDTNEIAHMLIEKFGSFSGVFDASYSNLTECGLSKSCAVLIKLFPAVCSKYYMDKYHPSAKKKSLITIDDIASVILPYFIGIDDEQVLILLLDAKGKKLYCDVVNKGSLTASEVNIRRILQLAVQYKARGAVLAHNHPSGIARPSGQDIAVTKSLKKALSAVGVSLLEHLIVADMDFCAMSNLPECFEVFL